VRHFGARSRRPCGPVDLFGRCDPVRVLVAGGQGQPCAHRKLARPRLTVGPAQSEGSARRVPIERPARAVMEGGNAYPSCLEQVSSLRDTRMGDRSGKLLQSSRYAHAGSSGERWRHRSGLNGQEGAEPSDGERLPTRSKPSKGEALVGMRTASEANSGHLPGDAARHRAHDGPAETQRTPCPVPGCNRPGTHAAEETVEVVEDHRGGTRTAAAMPRSKLGRKLEGSGRAWARRRRGTRQSQGRMILPASAHLATGDLGTGRSARFLARRR
jgi:hypothetical protein